MLIVETSKYTGHNLIALPYYGYGWSKKNSAQEILGPLDKLGPEPFHLKILKFIYCNEHTMGMSGCVDEPGHNLHGCWCACLLRNTDDSDFTTHPGQYMIWIAQKELEISPAPYPEKALYEWVRFDKSEFCLCGYGTVAESVQWIEDIYKITMNSRKLVSEEGGKSV